MPDSNSGHGWLTGTADPDNFYPARELREDIEADLMPRKPGIAEEMERLGLTDDDVMDLPDQDEEETVR
jgi:hypothetical protein